jgi:hypothetical protein
MRLSLTLCRNTVVGAAAFALLTACGGGSSNSSSSSSSSESTSSSASSSSAEATGAAADTEFCQQTAALINSIGPAFTSADPSQLGSIFQDLSSKVRAIDPPAELSQDWETFASGLEQLGQLASQTDFNNQEQAAAFQKKVTDLSAQLDASSTKIETYLSTQCGIDTSGDSGESATPTS